MGEIFGLIFIIVGMIVIPTVLIFKSIRKEGRNR